MRFEATPPPSPPEAGALAVALERVLGRGGAPPSYSSLWRIAGIRENAAPEEAATVARSVMTQRPMRR